MTNRFLTTLFRPLHQSKNEERTIEIQCQAYPKHKNWISSKDIALLTGFTNCPECFNLALVVRKCGQLSLVQESSMEGSLSLD